MNEYVRVNDGLILVKIGVFYIIYYAFLAGFFMGMLLIFYQTLDTKSPRWQNSNGLIGANPGTQILNFVYIYVR